MRIDDGLAAEQQHRGETKLGQEADDRVVGGLQTRGDHRLVEYARDAVAEALQLARLAREGLHDAHARDVLLGVRGELADALLDLLDGGAGTLSVALGDEHHERHRRQGDRA